MTISSYLTVALGVLAFFLLVAFVFSLFGRKRGGYKNVVPWMVSGVILMALLAPGVVKKYLFPTDPSVFGNADYHLLVHKGFNVQAPFLLVDSDENSFDALYDDKKGYVALTKDTAVHLEVKGYYRPLYVTMPDRRGFLNKKLLGGLGLSHAPDPQLLNRYYESDCSEGFVIKQGDEVLYSLEIVPVKKWWQFKSKAKSFLYISRLGNEETGDTSEFKRPIRKGYSLLSIVAATPNFVVPDNLRDLLDGTTLVRECPDAKLKHNNLVLMPGVALATDPTLEVNACVADAEQTFESVLPSEAKIWSGFGSSMTKELVVDTLENGFLTLRYSMPDRKQLRNQSGTVLLTSSVDVVANSLIDSASFDSQTGVYLYNIFDDDGNMNHFHGQMRYAVGDARSDILFSVHDYFTRDGINADTVVAANKNFELKARGSEIDKGREWVFCVENMRDTNALTYGKIMWLFVGMFTLLVCVRVVLASLLSAHSKRGLLSLSLFEMGVYVVILAFGVTRLILAWRSSTFVPLDGIGVKAFNVMRKNVLPFTCGVCWSVPLVLTLWNLLTDSAREWLSNRWQWLRGLVLNLKCSKRWPLATMVVVYGVLLLLCYLLGKGVDKLARICNILLPVLLYFYFDNRMSEAVAEEAETKEGLLRSRLLAGGWGRPLLLVMTIGALFLFDAGFAVLFLVWSMLRLGVSLLTAESRSKVWERVCGILLWVLMLALAFLFVLSEGPIMKWSIGHLPLLVPLGVGVGFLGFAVLLYAWHERRLKASLFIAGAGLAIALLLWSNLFGVGAKVRNVISEKGIHMKYRAEVQDLKVNESVDKLMEECGFNSRDIMFIMRSAQNQWFLNQYLYAARTKQDNYFTLQPHSAQGSPYNTQTTDVVVTRYVKAEHKGPIAERMLMMLMALMALYSLEVSLEGNANRRSRLMFSGLLLLFVIAFSVYTSATNRTVFMGQDFPFLSIQSRLTLLLPCALMLIAAIHASLIVEEMDGGTFDESPGELYYYRPTRDKLWIPAFWIVLGIGVFAFAGWKLIPPKGAHQSGDQFDVTRIIDNVSHEIEDINETLTMLQDQYPKLKSGTPEVLWETFKEKSPKQWEEVSDTLREGHHFMGSLMLYFDDLQQDKCDANELIHLSRRNGVYRLRVNRKFYFIESIIDRGDPWTGDVMAAQTPLFYSLRDIGNPNANRQAERIRTDGYETNILPEWLQDSLPSISLMRFDSLWTPDHTPLLLVKTFSNEKQFFNLENDDYSSRGFKSNGQMTTRLFNNDMIEFNKKVRGGVKTFKSLRYGKDNQRYLAKNIWINGRRQLFYPLGKESMWSYQFANLVKNVYGNESLTDSSFRHRSLRVSIDYDLHKAMYDTMSKINASEVQMPRALYDNIVAFSGERYSSKLLKNKHYYLFYNDSVRRFESTGNYRNTRTLDGVLKKANRILARELRRNDIDSVAVSNTLEQLLRRKFSYSCVVLDSRGRIRLLFDHNKSGRKVDPNNIRHLNKFLSDLYRDGSNMEERELLGNLSIEHLVPGPGSTFKPVMYTAVTSTEHLDWESLDMSGEVPPGNRDTSTVKAATQIKNADNYFLNYGGVNVRDAHIKNFAIAGGSSGLQHDNYIIHSNNRYHSMIVLFGMQAHDQAKEIIGDAVPGLAGFPQFKYSDGRWHSFRPEVWWEDHRKVGEGQSIMEIGLFNNFRLHPGKLTHGEDWYNAYGDSPEIEVLFRQKKYGKYWSFPEAGTMRHDLRVLDPWMRNAFVQMQSGSYPLHVSPLQMATFGMRLATLNRAESLTTLSDSVPPRDESYYIDFDVLNGRWQSMQSYYEFYRRQVLKQMRAVPRSGTAKVLNNRHNKNYVDKLEEQNLYLYAKTGTLNEADDRRTRIRHLMVIIANKPLEDADNVEELRKIRYYVMYMTFRDINVNPRGGEEREYFTVSDFKPEIEAVVKSSLFQHFMFDEE